MLIRTGDEIHLKCDECPEEFFPDDPDTEEDFVLLEAEAYGWLEEGSKHYCEKCARKCAA